MSDYPRKVCDALGFHEWIGLFRDIQKCTWCGVKRTEYEGTDDGKDI